MKVWWTEEALSNLQEIEAYISQDNPSAAVEFIDSLIDKGETLSKNAERGRKVAEIPDKTVRELIFRNYRIVYRVMNTDVYILSVFESHRQTPIK